MSTTTDTAPLKEIQKFIWSQGSYEHLARQVMPVAEALVDACGIARDDEVLDVAAGTGNVAVAAARRGARVVASDITPHMVELGRARCADAGLTVDWREADAEALPFADASFDAVLSTFGAMFAPRPEVAARELFRVVRPGGCVGMANWPPESFVGRALALISSYMPPPPEGIARPTAWGVEATVRERLAGLADDVALERRTVLVEHPSVDAMFDYQRANTGPLVAASMALGERFAELAAEMRALIAELNEATDGTVRIPFVYLLIVARAPQADRAGS
jgi:SAM-dependent methyltransferase